MSTTTATDRPTLLPDLDAPGLVWRAGLLDSVTTALAMNYVGMAGEANPLVAGFVELVWLNPLPLLGRSLFFGEALLALFGLKVMVTWACVALLRRGWGHVESVPYGPAYVRVLALVYAALGPLVNLWVMAT